MCNAEARIAIIAKADPEEADAGGLRLQRLPDHFREAVRYLASLDPKPCICDNICGLQVVDSENACVYLVWDVHWQ